MGCFHHEDSVRSSLHFSRVRDWSSQTQSSRFSALGRLVERSANYFNWSSPFWWKHPPFSGSTARCQGLLSLHMRVWQIRRRERSAWPVMQEIHGTSSAPLNGQWYHLASRETCQSSCSQRTNGSCSPELQEKRPDGAMLIPWSRSKALAWDVTIPDTYSMSHIQSTFVDSGSTAKHATRMKTLKYQDLNAIHIFYPIAIETAGSWNDQAVELIEEIGWRSAQEMDDPKKTMYLFQRISVAIQRGNALAFINTFDTDNI